MIRMLPNDIRTSTQQQTYTYKRKHYCKEKDVHSYGS